jgi:ubiquinone/menaquinone biosynthesis C-methylase UbiE
MKLARITSVYRSKIIAQAYRKWLESKFKVLDIGSGTGIVASELNKYYQFKKITGCDIQEYLLTDIKFKRMKSPTKLPFKRKSFDVAMYNDVLHHMDYANQPILIKESLRVAKYVLIFELKPTLLGKSGDYILNKFHNSAMDIPYTYRSNIEWETLFRKLVVKFEKKNVDTPFWYPFTHTAYRLQLK